MKRTFYITHKTHFVSKMMHLFLISCFFNFTTLPMQAQQESIIEQSGGTLKVLKEMPISQPTNLSIQGFLPVDPNAVYSNVTTFAGNAYSNGGSTTTSGNTITRLVADSLGLVGTPPFAINGFVFSVANLNTVTVSARPRVRFYRPDNPAGGPGTYITGYSFNATSLTASSVILLTATNGIAFNIPDRSIWVGITFDDNTGVTGATVAQLDLIGQGIYNPIDVGSSTDGFYRTNIAGSFLSSNPASAFSYFGGTPAANFGWELRGSATIPVELLTFSARPSQQTTTLDWQTASENNNKGFQIERQEGINASWETIGFVAGKGKAATYQFLDKTPLNVNYYRLRQIDNDGVEKFSKVVSVTFKSEKVVKVFPSVANDFVTVETTGTNDFAIFNLLGQQVLNGKSTQRINVSTLPQGAYVLKVGDAQAKFVKQ